MKYLTFISLLFLNYLSFSQGGLLINGGQLVMQPTSHVVIAGTGYWTNNGTVTANTGSWLHMSGTAIQNIQGASNTTFSNLDINNTNAVNIAVNTTINGSLQLTAGYCDLKNSIVTFGITANITGGETETKRIRSTDAGGLEGQGTGIITTTRPNPFGNIANLGLDFTPVAALGNTVLIRGHLEQTGTGSFAANKSVFRYYDIQPTVQSNVTINSFNYFDAELGTQAPNEANLEMFQWVQIGAPQWCMPRTTTGSSTVTNYVASTTTTNTLTTYKITLGSTTAPLPVELIEFKANCNKGYNDIYWQTASEYNCESFTVEKSLDAINFTAFTKVNSYGNSNITQNYSVKDIEPNKNIYYRLKQTDINGNYTYSNVIFLSCSLENYDEDILPIYPVTDNLNAIVKGLSGKSYKINITDVLGQVITNKEIVLSDAQQTIQLSDNFLAKGIYYVTLSTGNKNISKPIIIQ